MLEVVSELHSSTVAEFGLVFVIVPMDWQEVAVEVELRPRVVEADLELGHLPMLVGVPDDVAVVPKMVVAVLLVEPKGVVVVFLAELVEPMVAVLEVFAEVVEPMAAPVESLYGEAASIDSGVVSVLVLGFDSRMPVFAASVASPS